MRKLIFILIVIMLAVALRAQTRVIPLKEIMKPGGFFFDQKQLYITEGTTIHIYSLEGFKYKKKFGQKGEGPKEFLLNPQAELFICVQGQDLLITSIGKVSFFTKNGVFKKSIRLKNPGTFGMQRFGEDFYIANSFIMKNNLIYRVLNQYDKDFNIVRQVTKIKHYFQQGKGIDMFKDNPQRFVNKDKVFFGWDNSQLKLEVRGVDKKLAYSIKHPIKRIKVTESIKNKIIEDIKTQSPQQYLRMKPIRFAKYFPAILDLQISDGYVYVGTYNWEKVDKEIKLFEYFIFDLKGEFIKTIKVKLVMADYFTPHPIRIHKGVLYQLFEDLEKEEWRLHSTKILTKQLNKKEKI